MSRLAGPDAQADREVGLAGPRWSEKDDVVLGRDEVERAEVGDDFPTKRALVVEVELFDGLAGREASSADPDLAAVGLASGDPAQPDVRWTGPARAP